MRAQPYNPAATTEPLIRLKPRFDSRAAVLRARLGLNVGQANLLLTLIDATRLPQRWSREDLDDVRYRIAKSGYGFVRPSIRTDEGMQIVGDCLAWLRSKVPEVFEGAST